MNGKVQVASCLGIAAVEMGGPRRPFSRVDRLVVLRDLGYLVGKKVIFLLTTFKYKISIYLMPHGSKNQQMDGQLGIGNGRRPSYHMF